MEIELPQYGPENIESDYEWSESGIQLLKNINKVIEENGGREVMTLIVSREIAAFKHPDIGWDKFPMIYRVMKMKEHNLKHSTIMDVMSLTSGQLNEILDYLNKKKDVRI